MVDGRALLGREESVEGSSLSSKERRSGPGTGLKARPFPFPLSTGEAGSLEKRDLMKARDERFSGSAVVFTCGEVAGVSMQRQEDA